MSESGIPQGTDHQSGRESAQIIFMGDVRRRRGRTRQAPDRQYLGAFALLAAAAWSVWITVLFSLPPARLFTYLAFFAPLFVAFASSAALVVYGFEWKQGNRPSLRSVARRGTLFALLVTANLAFLAAHRWSPVVAILTILLVLGAEASFLRRGA